MCAGNTWLLQSERKISRKAKYPFYNDIDEWELYDLLKDPEEMKNIINSETHIQLIDSLKIELAKLQELYKDTDRSTY